MFPNSFSARVAERMAVWSGLLGFLLLLHGAVEFIQSKRMDEILQDRRAASAALVDHAKAADVTANESRTKAGQAIATRIQALDQRQASVLESHRQNKLLIGLLALFVVAQILFLEYRWLVKPIVRIAAVL